MTVIKTKAGKPYSQDFLTQLAWDLHDLAVDLKNQTNQSLNAELLMQAGDIVNRIAEDNADET